MLPCPTRRRFLGFASSLAVVGGLATRMPAWGASGETTRKLNLGIQLYSLRGFPVDVALQHAKDIGFQQVEFYSGMLALDASDEVIQKTVAQVKELGLTISAHGVNRFTADENANRRIFEFAKKAGIRTLSADPDPDAFASLDKLVREFDIRIAIHNHGPSHRYNKAMDVLKAVEGHDERIGACADLGHYIRSGEKPVDVIRLLQGRLYGIHLKDFDQMQEKAKGVLLGQGHLNCAEVFEALEKAKFPSDGALSLEYEENPKDPIADIRECYRTAKSALPTG